MLYDIQVRAPCSLIVGRFQKHGLSCFSGDSNVGNIVMFCPNQFKQKISSLLNRQGLSCEESMCRTLTLVWQGGQGERG